MLQDFPGASPLAADTLTIAGMLAAPAAATPDAIAITAPGRSPLTYGALWPLVAGIAQQLQRRGLRCRDRVALVIPDGPDAIVAGLAVSTCAASIPLNPALSREEFELYFKHLGARALLVQAGTAPAARAAAQRQGLPTVELVPMRQTAGQPFTLRGEAWGAPATPSFVQPTDVAVVFHTSGTTGRPKVVPSTHANNLLRAHATAASLGLTTNDRCLSVMPLFHISGYRTAVLASLAVGASVVCTPGFAPERFFAWLDAHQPTWYNAVPSIHRAILAQAARHADVLARHSLRFIQSGSASLPQDLRAELEAVFHAPVLDGYGLVEAGGIATTPLPPAMSKPGSVGRVMAGMEVTTLDEAGAPLPSGQSGEVVVRGPRVFDGYENDPAANAAAFTDGWFRTGDEGYVDADGYLFLTGRRKEQINRGGEKVSPLEVDDVLLTHPAVADAAAFGMPDPVLGEAIAAAVVLRPGFVVTDAELRAFIATRLAAFKIPRLVVFVDALPTNAAGKVQRSSLAEQLGLVGSRPRTGAAPKSVAGPRTPIEARVTNIWAEVLGIEQIARDERFLDLGGDSVRAGLVIARLQETLSAELSLSDFFETATVAEMSVLITQRLAEQVGES